MNLPDNPSDAVKRRNPNLFAPCGCAATPPDSVKPTPKRIRQDNKPLMNGLETRFWEEYLSQHYPKARAQYLKFRLGNGIAYKPDFVDLSVHPVKAWEVKGPHAFRGGFENLKVAAALYPEVRWILVWRINGQWELQEVLR